ncbi:MAG TPA: RAMP superfamily CRISPR-associated protein, partial [Caldilineaceae bacterium]|nr:RAMP superfamily CRISPR-associated protein [Caldilineaceae bacterium]
ATPTDKPVPSRVSIRLRLESGGQRIFWDDLPSALDYALFPLRGSQTWLLKDVRFSLELTYCQQDAAEVRAALWAWETFGGLGARTRRGFGALQCTAVNGTPVQPPATVEQAREAIHNGLLTHVADGLWHSHVPHLHRPTPGAAYAVANDRFRLVEKDSVAEAHAYLIRRLRSIIFHFKTDNDPPDHTLQGVNHDRLASPLILRPLVLANKAAAALAICLDAPIVPPGGLTLDPPAVVSPAPPLRADLTARDAQTTPLSVPLNKEPDILLAFLNRL